MENLVNIRVLYWKSYKKFHSMILKLLFFLYLVIRDSEQMNRMVYVLYANVAFVMYVIIYTRPDIAYAVSVLSRF